VPSRAHAEHDCFGARCHDLRKKRNQAGAGVRHDGRAAVFGFRVGSGIDHVTEIPRAGYAKARNQGCAKSRGKAVAGIRCAREKGYKENKKEKDQEEIVFKEEVDKEIISQGATTEKQRRWWKQQQWKFQQRELQQRELQQRQRKQRQW
jgi:hypothetical protein